tara:strand:+ start:322 stop:1053 length:732 start_codon:yes stop_codon:yes gene_type:complete
MKKLYLITLALMCFGLLFPLEQVIDNHPNGMPKVIKTYKNSNNLELIKEVGYYSNGAKEYQLTYYKGKVKDTKRWDINGVKIDWLNDNPDSSIVFEVRTFQNRSYIISNGVMEFLNSDWYPAAVFNPSEGKLMPYGKENPDKKNPLYSIFIEPNDPEFSCRGRNKDVSCEIYPIIIENFESIDKVEDYQLGDLKRKISKDEIRTGKGDFFIKTNQGNSIIRILNFKGERMVNGHLVFKWKRIP